MGHLVLSWPCGRWCNCVGCSAIDRICLDCGIIWCPTTGGAGKRSYCEKCYPRYRQAYNLLSAARYRASDDFDLDFSFVFERLKEPCPRTGFNFVIGSGSNYQNRHPQTPSIDKIDPSGGYTKDNVQIVCWWYNCAKQRYTDDEVLQFCRAVVDSSDI